MSMDMKASALPDNLFICVLASGLLLLLDVTLCRPLVQQWETMGYSTAQGIISHSGSTHEGGRDGPIPSIYKVRYAYTIDGRDYSNNVLSFSRFVKGVPVALHERWRVDSTVPVYYSEGDPKRAVLLKGVQGSDLSCLLLLLPFHLLLAGFWYALVRSYARRSDRLGVFIRDGRMHVPMSLGLGWGPLLVLGLWILGFLVCALTDDPTPLGPLVLCWALVLGGLGIVAWRWRRARRSGAFDLVLDGRYEWISLPLWSDRPEVLRLPLSRHLRLRLDTSQRRRRGGSSVLCYKPILTVRTAEGEYVDMPLVEWVDDLERAEALMAWLRQHGGRALRDER